jgi:DNA mismatch endonuclease (patch repair protein)
MAAIRGADTKPEMIIRRGLHARGFRFRLHDRKLPGRPDLVFPRFAAVVFVNGCFWHGHDCALFKWPKTREEFWREKIEGNRRRDTRSAEMLLAAGWRVATVWECALKGPERLLGDDVIDRIATWLSSDRKETSFRGQETV